MFALLFALALPAATPPADPFAQRAWAHFSRSPALAHSVERVEVATAAVDPSTRALSYTLRLTRTKLSRPDEVLWADSRTCAAVRPVLESMMALPPPRVAVPGMETEQGDLILDGTGYRLSAPARFIGRGDGQIAFGSNIGTPLAAWVDQSLAALERCWSAVELRAAG